MAPETTKIPSDKRRHRNSLVGPRRRNDRRYRSVRHKTHLHGLLPIRLLQECIVGIDRDLQLDNNGQRMLGYGFREDILNHNIQSPRAPLCAVVLDFVLED